MDSSRQGVELVHCSLTRMKTVLFLRGATIARILLSSTLECSQVWSPDSLNTPFCPTFWIEWAPCWSANPDALSPTAVQCCRGVSARMAPKHSETWGPLSWSHPFPVPFHCVASQLRQWLQLMRWINQPRTPPPLPPLWKVRQWDMAAAPHFHCKQCWWGTASPSNHTVCQNFFKTK